jgi:dihydrolipoamide dehydrogenase
MHIVVIGGGPGGYVSAIRAAQLGADVTIVERRFYGGTCLNIGCIPTKVLLHTAELFHTLKSESESLGLEISKVALNWEKLQLRKQGVVGQLVGGVEMLLKSNGIQMMSGNAAFVNEKTLAVTLATGAIETLTFDKAIIATGSESIVLPIEGAKLEGVITSEEALSLPHLPDSICIIGGGVIGSEFASLYASLGVKVFIVEMMTNIVSVMDEDVVAVLKASLEASGVEIYTGTRVMRIEKAEDKLCVVTDGGEFVVEKVLMATGRRPNTDGLHPEAAGIKLDRNSIVVNPKTMQSSKPHIYAIGDCNGGILLAHVASAEGVIAAEHAMKRQPKMVMSTTPSAVYTNPELASVGLTEVEAKKAGYAVKTGVFPLYANGKALIMNGQNGILKFVVDGATDEILGIHMAGPRATDLIAEGALALRLEATVDEIVSTVHAHPTVSESFHEAAHAVHGHAIHLPK